MAAMAGHVDHFVALYRILDLLDMVDADAVVDLVPEPGQHHLEKAHRGVGVVRGDLVAVAQGLGLGFFDGDVLPLGFLADRLAHLRRMHQAFDQVAPVRQVGADHGGFLVAEMHPQHAMGHAQRALVPLVLRHQFAELDGRGELHAGLAPEDQDAQQLAQPPGHCPAVGEQQLPGASLAIRRLAPEHAHRDDLRVVHGILLQRADQPHQRRWRHHPGAAAEPARSRVEEDERRWLDMVAHGNLGHRTRQAGLAALVVEYRQVAQRGTLQHVEHRLATVQLEVEGRLADGFRANPEIQDAAHDGEEQTTDRGAGHTKIRQKRGRALEGGKCAASAGSGQKN